MNEGPMLMSGAMVRQILAGNKTQTRRVVKVQPPPGTERLATIALMPPRRDGTATENHWWPSFAITPECPYGKPGDRLWVRENLKRPDGDPWLYAADDQPVMVDARDETAMVVWAHHKQRDYCPSIHMPRWASRITLEIVDVLVERLQDISEEDAKAEGCVAESSEGTGLGPGMFTAKLDFAMLWDSINEKRGFGWSVNPWVWCVSFRRAERYGIDCDSASAALVAAREGRT